MGTPCGNPRCEHAFHDGACPRFIVMEGGGAIRCPCTEYVAPAPHICLCKLGPAMHGLGCICECGKPALCAGEWWHQWCQPAVAPATPETLTFDQLNEQIESGELTYRKAIEKGILPAPRPTEPAVSGAAVCSAETPCVEDGRKMGSWLCTLPPGHKGDHIAHGFPNEVLHRWPAASAAAPPVEGARLTDRQLREGLHQARRVIREAVGYYFGGDLTEFSPDFKKLALAALDQQEAEIARLRHQSTELAVIACDRAGELSRLREENERQNGAVSEYIEKRSAEDLRRTKELAALRENMLTPLEAGWCIESFPLEADEERALTAKLRHIAGGESK